MINDESDVLMAELAAVVPGDKAKMMDAAMAAVIEFHRSVIAKDQVSATAAANLYTATIWKMNGGSMFGCATDENAPANLIENHCRAVPGEIPLWGQAGDFLVTVDGMRVRVGFSCNAKMDFCHFECHAVDLDGLFVSETGYRSEFNQICCGFTVEDVATRTVSELIKFKRHPIMPRYRDRLALQSLPDWLTAVRPAPRWTSATVAVPPGFEKVSVVLSEHQAFLAKKWAEKARGKVSKFEEELRAKASAEESARAEERVEKKARAKERAIAREKTIVATPFKIGQRCQVVSVHHSCATQ